MHDVWSFVPYIVHNVWTFVKVEVYKLHLPYGLLRQVWRDVIQVLDNPKDLTPNPSPIFKQNICEVVSVGRYLSSLLVDLKVHYNHDVQWFWTK